MIKIQYTQLLPSSIFCPRIHPVLSYLPSYPSPPRAINLAQFADLSRRNQEGANSSDPIRRHSSERAGVEAGKKEGDLQRDGRTDGRAASEFNYLQINQRLLECRQISQVSLAARRGQQERLGGGGETSKPDRTRYFPKQRNDWKEEASRWQGNPPLHAITVFSWRSRKRCIFWSCAFRSR